MGITLSKAELLMEHKEQKSKPRHNLSSPKKILKSNSIRQLPREISNI